jgi:DNA-binding PadR family transcriptional regulator
MSIYKGHLRLIVLKILKDKEMCGYELISEIEKETGWKPSFGSIYPLLNNLHENKFLEIKKEGKLKKYSVTKKGRSFFTEVIKRKSEILDKIIENVKLFDVICGVNHSKQVIPMLDEIKRGKSSPPIFVEHEMTEFSNLIFRVISQKNREKNKKMKKLLSEWNKKLYRLTKERK